ncbi:hypothetical protein [Microbacterium rhizomatis]|uniref:Uncharacterized protein n=1 Tax=Microbacterium rhizomatis TaxID=1631477 RepID=A0A5J5J1E5_9MICO|nr:hypothetical protein [Microbacterium rhizomatis]KAA9108295.1 hypothetical protein F6B43_12940 [Microbacterium rhizomatis]
MALIDSALAVRPTVDPIVVTLTGASARIPDDPAPGTRTFEPSFLTSYLTGKDYRPFPQATVVRLLIPEGTPALFQEPALPDNPGTLLLGRGIEWEIDRVVTLPDHTLVTAHVVARRPGDL